MSAGTRILRVLFYSQRVFANKINRAEIKGKKGVYFRGVQLSGDMCGREYIIRDAPARQARA